MPPLAARAPSDEPPLTTVVEERAAAVLVHVAGEIDLSTIGDFETAVGQAEADLAPGKEGTSVVVIDLRGVTFLGAEGLRSLVAAQNRISDTGGSMRVVAPGGGGIVRRLLDLSGVGSLLDLFETVEAALPPHRD